MCALDLRALFTLYAPMREHLPGLVALALIATGFIAWRHVRPRPILGLHAVAGVVCASIIHDMWWDRVSCHGLALDWWIVWRPALVALCLAIEIARHLRRPARGSAVVIRG